VACPAEGANQVRYSKDQHAKNRDRPVERARRTQIGNHWCQGKSRALRRAGLSQNPWRSDQHKNSAPRLKLAWRIRGKEEARLSILSRFYRSVVSRPTASLLDEFRVPAFNN